MRVLALTTAESGLSRASSLSLARFCTEEPLPSGCCFTVKVFHVWEEIRAGTCFFPLSFPILDLYENPDNFLKTTCHSASLGLAAACFLWRRRRSYVWAEYKAPVRQKSAWALKFSVPSSSPRQPPPCSSVRFNHAAKSAPVSGVADLFCLTFLAGRGEGRHNSLALEKRTKKFRSHKLPCADVAAVDANSSSGVGDQL